MRDQVARATVQLTTDKGAGQGVLVPGNFILTAAHCIEWHTRGAMAFGEPHPHWIKTADGVDLCVDVCAVEPVADIAVLSSMDNQQCPMFADPFEQFSEATAPIPICFDRPEVEVESAASLQEAVEKAKAAQLMFFPVHIHTHHRAWIDGEARVSGRNICVRTKGVESGTSGGPIVNNSGELVGVVSQTSETTDSGMQDGRHPYLALTLPVWLLEEIKKAST